ncbi:MAG: bifunctional 4-hydroxy-2-oxoglutarate aldolase/2-dehydro-3-deoxy-phosphogluconate aldolase [Fibrobacteraceae bacterium]|nr:bifunctional 4-hydroxy-2-oxoglutarate aldolase/2-dehydro-3-deoxy-phosphogluconate aldolase [Fibrobacteraceae bacterium]
MNLLEFLSDKPVVGILRDVPLKDANQVVQVSAACGLKAIEVTMNTAEATDIIKAMKAAAEPYGIAVGAGTVRHSKDLDQALAAGAQFIVTPNTRHEIIRTAATAGIPIIPGALTPTEVQKAYDLGATAVKIFPVNCVGGPEYIKALRGPFRDIPLMACGGVNAQNAKEYLNSGANLISFGASIFNVTKMQNSQWNLIQSNLEALLNSIK